MRSRVKCLVFYISCYKCRWSCYTRYIPSMAVFYKLSSIGLSNSLELKAARYSCVPLVKYFLSRFMFFNKLVKLILVSKNVCQIIKCFYLFIIVGHFDHQMPLLITHLKNVCHVDRRFPFLTICFLTLLVMLIVDFLF